MRSTKLLALALMLFAVTVHAGRKSGSADKDRPKKKSKATAEDDSTDTTNTDPIANEGEDWKETHHCCGYTITPYHSESTPPARSPCMTTIPALDCRIQSEEPNLRANALPRRRLTRCACALGRGY